MRHRWLVLLNVGTLGILIGAAGCSSGAATPTPGPTVTRTMDLPAGVSSIAVGGSPVGMALAPDGRIWIALADDNSVVALTPDGDGYEVGEPIPVGGLPLRLRIDASGLWVSLFDRGRVVRVDPDSGAVGEPIPAGAEPEGLALVGDTLWVVDQSGSTVSPLSTTTGILAAGATVGRGPRLVAPAGDGVVVTSYEAGTVSAVAADLTVRESGPVCPSAQGVVVDETGRVFVTCTDTGELVALDLATLAETGRVGDLTRPDAVVSGPDGTLYVALQRGPAIVAYDPATLTEIGRVTVGDDLAGLDSNVDLVVDPSGQLVMTWPERDLVLLLPQP